MVAKDSTDTLVDVEIGSKSVKFEYKPLLPPEEPYINLDEISLLHSDSHIHLMNVEKSMGLSPDEAATRLNLYGRNALTPPPRMPDWKRFFLQFKNAALIWLQIYFLLWLIIYIISGDLFFLDMAIVYIVVVALAAYIQFHIDGNAFKAIDSFSKMLASDCVVIRGGKELTIPTDQLVPGDLLKIQNGDRVPADLVLLLCRNLKADYSSFTGESEPISCSTSVSPKGKPFFECKNVAFNNSLCFDGMAIGLVFRTGDHTSITKLATNMKRCKKVLLNIVIFIITLVMLLGRTVEDWKPFRIRYFRIL